jgi:hypothetical protein
MCVCVLFVTGDLTYTGKSSLGRWAVGPGKTCRAVVLIVFDVDCGYGSTPAFTMVLCLVVRVLYTPTSGGVASYTIVILDDGVVVDS